MSPIFYMVAPAVQTAVILAAHPMKEPWGIREWLLLILGVIWIGTLLKWLWEEW
jgi:uncharacterized membrane protein